MIDELNPYLRTLPCCWQSILIRSKCLLHSPGSDIDMSQIKRQAFVTSLAVCLRILPHNPPRKLPERNPTLRIDNPIQIRLRKHRERISRHTLPRGSSGAAHEMRHRAELASGDELESLASLECERVSRDVDFDGLVLA